LRILCYHGFSEGDAIRYRPQTFIRPETLKKRIEYLKRKKYPIIGIEEGVSSLSKNCIPPCGTVITIDDGWFGIKEIAHELLTDQKFPYTIYVTSYYAEKETPIFEHVIRYMFWKTRAKNWDKIILNLTSEMTISPINRNSNKEMIEELIDFGEKKLDDQGRKLLMRRLAKLLGIDYDGLLQERTFSLLNSREIKELFRSGVSIQLHTHRHVWPMDFDHAKQEIVLNRCFLEPLTENPLEHFCYPNGSCQEEQFKYLDELVVKSATTCDPGLNYCHTNLFALRRYVDGENRSQIEFEAEMSGCTDVLRRIKNVLNFA